MADVSFTGGDKTKEFFKNAGKGGVEGVDVGVFDSSKYPDGTLVATVLAWNEFGINVPERPAFRSANKDNEKKIVRLIKKHIDTKKMTVTPKLAGLIGVNHQGAVQQSIVKLRTPGNAESTKKAKGSSNPLVDTGLMARSVTYKVNK